MFLPSASAAVGTQHASLFLPVWLEKDWGQWSAFGGGGCELNQGGDDRNFCQIGAVLARQFLPDLQLGLEVFHQTPDTLGGEASTSVGAGVRYDVTDNVHLLGYLARNIQEADPTEPYNWYASILFTF